MVFMQEVRNVYIYMFFFCWQGISPPKAEQPLQGMKLQEKVEDKQENHRSLYL